MSYKQKEILIFIKEKIASCGYSYEQHSFPSGAIILDVQIDETLCVIQLESDSIGISFISDQNSDFSTTPDYRFFDEEKFKNFFRERVSDSS